MRTQLHFCPIDALTLDETVDAVIRRIRAGGKPVQHCVVNTFKFLLMERDLELRKIVHHCEMINADGQSVVWALRMLGRPCPERVTGIDLMERLLARAAQEGLKVYFFGARPAVVEKVASLYQSQYPTLKIAGFQHGYFRREGEEAEAVQKIRDARPDILFVALDSPRKEFFLGRHLDTLQVPFAMGVGGSFDVAAGLYPRAPAWMQAHGLEWLWRLSLDPGRMWKRYLVSHLNFLWIVIKENGRRMLGEGPVASSRGNPPLS